MVWPIAATRSAVPTCNPSQHIHCHSRNILAQNFYFKKNVKNTKIDFTPFSISSKVTRVEKEHWPHTGHCTMPWSNISAYAWLAQQDADARRCASPEPAQLDEDHHDQPMSDRMRRFLGQPLVYSESVTQTDSPDSVYDDILSAGDGEQALQPKRKMPEWTVVKLTPRQPRQRTRMDIWCAARKKDFSLVVKNPGDRLADKTRAKRIAALLEKLHKMMRDKYGRTCKTLPLFFQKVQEDHGVTLLPKRMCEHCLWPSMVCKCCKTEELESGASIPLVQADKDAKTCERSAWGAPSVPAAAGLSVRPRTEADRILIALRRDLEKNGEFAGGS